MSTCRICSLEYTKARMEQVVCSIACARKIPIRARQTIKAQHKAKKQEAIKQTRAQKEALKTHPQLLAEAQKEFNAYVRLRDFGKSCICCNGSPQSSALTGGEWDAGHFRSRGACPELAFDEDNCHAQLKHCNRRAWDVASYRANLLDKIGAERLAALEGPHPPLKFTRDDLREKRDYYRAKANALRKASK